MVNSGWNFKTEQMKIALIGYGKMGRTIEAMGKAQGFQFPLVIDLDNGADLNKSNLSRVDVAIEFTVPSAAPGNIKKCIDHGVPVVSGTTGWTDGYAEIKDYCLKANGTLFYASNYSVGVNILFAMNRQLARIMNHFPGYRASIKEVHHVHKLDAPSGTALTLAGDLIDENERLRQWVLNPPFGQDGQDDPDSLHIESVREGEVKGQHIIRYESALDSLTLGHDAKSRDAFAEGALLAAAFLRGKTGIFGMKDLLNL